MSTTEELKSPRRPGPADPGWEASDESSDPGSHEVIIRPSRGWIAINWRELIQSHELFASLVQRDLKIRYKQTVLGVAWAVLQPLLMTIIFTFIFSRIPGVAPEGVPFPLFVLAGLVPWTFFSNAVSAAGMSLISQQQLLTKIYFPRLYVPASTVGAQLVDLSVGLSLFAILLPFYRVAPGPWILAVPPLMLLTFLAAFGVGLIMAAATVLYRDLRFVIPFAMQILMFTSPVFYSPGILPRPVQLLVSVNPMVGIIGGYRASILGGSWDPASLAISVASTAGLLLFGLFFFRKSERLFADVI